MKFWCNCCHCFVEPDDDDFCPYCGWHVHKTTTDAEGWLVGPHRSDTKCRICGGPCRCQDAKGE